MLVNFKQQNNLLPAMIRNPFFSVLNLLGELILYSAGHLRWGFGQKNFKLAGYGMADGIADKTGGYKLEIIKNYSE